MCDGAHFVARCARGLEPQVAAEILQLELGSITTIGHRTVHFRSPADARITSLRTADDVFLLAARGPDIGTARAGTPALAELAEAADTKTLLHHRNRLSGQGETVPGIEVSASFLGRRSFNRYDAEDAVGYALAARLDVPYHSRRTQGPPPPDYAGWRLTLDGATATLMLRITPRPLHRRAYRQSTVPGSLHPPLAAAMIRLADIGPGHTVLDPCCGAGTLLVEAALAHPEAAGYQGYDIDPAAIRAAHRNKQTAGTTAPLDRISIRRADAGQLPLPDATVDRIVCNPPWGTQVRPRARLAAAPTRWWPELRRTLAPTGTAVVLLPDPTPLSPAIQAGLIPTHTQRVHLAGTPTYLIKLQHPH